MSDKILQKRIMRRVYAVWILRKLSSQRFMKFLIFVGILRWSFMTVSVPNVIRNSPSMLDFPASYGFFSTAFARAEMNTKFLCIALLTMAIVLLYDFLKKTPAFNYKNVSE